jgi:hypothetical protein
MIADGSPVLGLLPGLQARVFQWYHRAGTRPAAGKLPGGFTESHVGAAMRSILRNHWVVVVFLIGMGLLSRFSG